MQDEDLDHLDEDTDTADEGRVSKTRRKKEMLHLQDLGVELAALSADRLKKMDLPEALLAALLEWQRIGKHGAKRRQMQYIGKLMRDIDPEPITAQLAALRGESDAAKAEFHALERWRERLLASDEAVTQWLSEYPDNDAQHLRQLIRNARKEAEQGKPPRSSRELFRMLREISAADTSAPAADQA
jgi:ribosome-associated protein